MGTYKKGILGSFIGKVGTVVGSTWRGRAVMRSLATKVHNPKTPAQVRQRLHLSATVSRLKPFAQAIRAGFVNTGDQSSWSAAQRVNYNLTKEQTEGQNDWSLEPKDIVLTNGQEEFTLTEASADANGTVSLEWDVNQASTFYDGTVYAVYYNETTGKAATFHSDYSSGGFSADAGKVVGEVSDTKHFYTFAATGKVSSPTSYKAVA